MGMFIGITAAFVLIVGAILVDGSLQDFINVPSILIVIGGTLAATFAKYSPKDVGKAFKTSMAAAKGSKEVNDLNELVDITEELLKKSRKDGLISIEGQESGNKFFDDGIAFMLAAPDRESLERYLGDEMYHFNKKGTRAKAVFDSMGDAAPAFGMIGTIIGLIQMLGSLDDPSSIGPALAVALLTTLYGAIIANAAFIPMGEKVDSWRAAKMHEMEFIAHALVNIKTGESPMVMREAVKPYLTHDFYKVTEAA